MEEMKCEVIRDLLPLYEDDAVSEETQELVRKHLKDCPACREELRKMRTPISLPPDEDEEAVRRFLEHRAEIRKKQNVKIACVVSVLAVLIVFILCYTLIPRSWDSVAGLFGSMEPDRIMGSHSVFIFHNDSPDIDLWQLDDEHDEDTDLINAVMDTLQTSSYRAELRNVMNHTPFAPFFQNRSVEGLKGSLFLYLVKDNGVQVSIHLYDTEDHSVHISTLGNPNTFYYRTDGKLYDTLSALIKEYGTFQEN